MRSLSLAVVGSLVVACGGSVDDSSQTQQQAFDSRGARIPAASEACDPGAVATCVLPDRTEGKRLCSVGHAWGDCAALENCWPGEVKDGWTCGIYSGVWRLGSEGGGGASSTPLVLSFDNAPVAFTNPSGSFDLVGREASFGTNWVSSASPWLALDQNGNGRIDDGRELFGSMTLLPTGARAANGFEALRALDANHDGRITEDDPAFASLLLWRDLDQNRASSDAELVRALDAGLVAIDLSYEIRPRCEGDACEMERATFTFRSERGTQRGSVIDVHFASR